LLPQGVEHNSQSAARLNAVSVEVDEVRIEATASKLPLVAGELVDHEGHADRRRLAVKAWVQGRE
jgi:hypothetical protein